MVTFDDLKRMFEEEQRRAREQTEESKQHKSGENRKQAEDRGTLEERARIEQERWGTPERAYHTWEGRIRALVDFGNQLVTEYRQQAESARLKYQAVSFPIYRRVRSAFRNRYYDEKVRMVSISELSAAPQKGLGSPLLTTYQLKLNDQFIFVNSFPFNEGTLFFQDSMVGHINGLLRELLFPQVAAQIIEKGKSRITEWAGSFFVAGSRLRSMPQERYSFLCYYHQSRHPTEDDLNGLYDRRDKFTQIPNPFHQGDIRKLIVPDTALVTSASGEAGWHGGMFS